MVDEGRGTERPRDDTPASNPVLARLDRLVGEWEVVVTRDERTFDGGRVTFDCQATGAFLVRRSTAGDWELDFDVTYERIDE